MSRWHTTEFDLLPERAFQPRGGRGKFSSGMTLEGGGKGGGAPAPDPRMAEAANRQIDLAEKQWAEYIKEGGDRDWMRGIADETLDISRSTADRTNALSDYQLEQMRMNNDRYWGNTVPYQDNVDSEIDRLYSREGIENQVNQATADVTGMTANARQQGLRSMSRMGINPMSGAFDQNNNNMSIQQATAMASAANKTRTAAEQAGLATRFQSLGAKLGMSGLGATNAGLATSALGMGLNAGQGMTGAGAASIGANNQTFGSTMGGMSAGISGLGSYTGLQQNAAKINNDADPFASLLGAGTTLGAAWIGKSDRRLKTDIVHVGVDEATGLNLYEFRYIDGVKRFRGVMADEVEVNYPEAVFTGPDGYKAVNYTALGIDMVLVEGETV
jgi:hypothetical protein